MILPLSFSSCDKHNQDYYAVRVECFIPYSNTPVKGLKYTIYETRDKKKWIGVGSSYQTGWTLNGLVDADGITETMFTRDNLPNSYYTGIFDYSGLDLPQGDYTIIGGNPGFDLDENHTEVIRMKILPKITIVSHFKNVNCVDSNDKFKFKMLNIDELPTEYYDLNNNPWSDYSAYYGCADLNFTSQQNSGRYVIQWEAVRGGVTTTGIDTFLVSPETTNTINMFW